MPNGQVTDFSPGRVRYSREEFLRSRRRDGMSNDDAIDSWDQLVASECFENDIYFVQLVKNPKDCASGAFTVFLLILSRLDGKPIEDWRDIQEMKNRFVGREVEAVELYPSRSRSFDYMNRTILFCFIGHRDTQHPTLPFGSAQRVISAVSMFPFAKQRPFFLSNSVSKEVSCETP
jgi:hypothetical protein